MPRFPYKMCNRGSLSVYSIERLMNTYTTLYSSENVPVLEMRLDGNESNF